MKTGEERSPKRLHLFLSEKRQRQRVQLRVEISDRREWFVVRRGLGHLGHLNLGERAQPLDDGLRREGLVGDDWIQRSITVESLLKKLGDAGEQWRRLLLALSLVECSSSATGFRQQAERVADRRRRLAKMG